MSQRNVERVIGRLVTDEAFRSQFATDPGSALDEIRGAGVELNDCERSAIARIDSAAVERFAETIDPKLQKSDLHGGCR
jgi:putative modified peptide